MPLNKWCQLGRDANVGRNAEEGSIRPPLQSEEEGQEAAPPPPLCQQQLSSEERGAPVAL